MRLANSWPMRWKTRSPPVRSTCTAMPGYFASNDLAIFSASGRSTEVYQTTLPSRLAASISAGVTAVGSGAAARSGAANSTAPVCAQAPAEALRMVRLEIVREGIRYRLLGQCERSEAISTIGTSSTGRDCFASLAMTAIARAERGHDGANHTRKILT